MNNLFDKWKQGLTRTSKAAFGQIASLLGATEITDELWDNLEAALIQADIGVETTLSIIEALEARVKKQGLTKSNQFRDTLREELLARLDPPSENRPLS